MFASIVVTSNNLPEAAMAALRKKLAEIDEIEGIKVEYEGED